MAAPLFERLQSTAVGTALPLSDVLDALTFDADGLIPAIARDHTSGAVLMMAWMNRTALDETLATGRVCYYSRSRRALWRKGERSGNVQQLIELRFDCDGDTLLLEVEQQGPACHTGRSSCFYLKAEHDQVVVTAVPERDPRDMYK